MMQTDGTTWDLATDIGATAMMAAAARARATTSGVINDPFAEPLIRAVGAEIFLRMARGETDTAGLGDGTGFDRTPDFFVAATRYFDDVLAAAGRAGLRQAVILGSGLDTRPYRLWWPAGSTVYELDRPQVIEFKTRTLRDLGAAPTVHRRAVGVDLGQDWPTALRQIGFDATAPSVWIAEGLLGLSSADVQDRLLDGITALSATGTRFAADVGLPAREAGDRQDVAGYLQASGWTTVVARTTDVFAANGFPPPSADIGGFPIGYLRATRR